MGCQGGGGAGIVFQIAGFAVQIALSPTCGDAAYENCFRDCPLPAPYFNHNALFHVLYAVGMVPVAIGWNLNPVPPDFRPLWGKNTLGDEVTSTSDQDVE